MGALSNTIANGLPAKLKLAYDYWLSLKGDQLLPSKGDFDPIEIPAVLSHVILVEIVHGPPENSSFDFEFKVMGSCLTERLKANYTGMLLSEIPGKQPGSEIWNAYKATVESKSIQHIGLNYAGDDQFIARTQEIYLPFSGDNPDEVSFVLCVVEFINHHF